MKSQFNLKDYIPLNHTQLAFVVSSLQIYTVHLDILPQY